MITLFVTEGYKGFLCHCCKQPCDSENNLTDMQHTCKCGAVYAKNHPASPVWFLIKQPDKENCK